MATSHAALVWQRRSMEVAYLADGTPTLDRDRARREVRDADDRLLAAERQARDEILGSDRPARRAAERLALLLSSARELSNPARSGPPTPGRIGAVRQLVSEGRLTARQADLFMTGEHISDAAWGLVTQMQAPGFWVDSAESSPSNPTSPADRLAALLGAARALPTRGRAGRSTPSRARDVQCLVDQGRLSAADVELFVTDDHVGDDGWRLVQQLQDPAFWTEDPGFVPVARGHRDSRPVEPVSRTMTLWTATLHSAAGVVGVGMDPLGYRDADLPLTAMTRVLDDLANEGWQLVHVAEDRAVDDAATHSYVTAVRYLLVRD